MNGRNAVAIAGVPVPRAARACPALAGMIVQEVQDPVESVLKDPARAEIGETAPDVASKEVNVAMSAGKLRLRCRR